MWTPGPAGAPRAARPRPCDPPPLASIVISPSSATITAGGSQAYTAEGFDTYLNSRGDVTGSTSFDVDSVACTGAVCGSTLAGDHTVTGTNGAFTDTASLHVDPAALHHF